MNFLKNFFNSSCLCMTDEEPTTFDASQADDFPTSFETEKELSHSDFTDTTDDESIYGINTLTDNSNPEVSYSDAESNFSSSSRKNSHYNQSLPEGYEDDLQRLQCISIRHYITARNMKTENVNKLIAFLKKYDHLYNVSTIEDKTGLNRSTIYNWHNKLIQNPNWSPLICKKIPTHKAMTDLLEDSIMNHIITNFLNKGLQFNDRLCKMIALQFWEQYPEEHIASSFKASYNWIKNFKSKYDIVNRHVHYKRRPIKNEKYMRIIKEFYDRVINIYKQHEENDTLYLMLNIDETSWKTFNFGEMTWAAKGAEHVEFSSVWNDKECITALAAITADPELYKLPLCIIRKGKTNQSKRVFSDCNEYFQLFITENGWSTSECFAQYLIWLRAELNERYKEKDNFTETTEIDLILDLYASHATEELKKIAKILHFNLIYIPAGATDAFQPLDRYVFGALKNMARAIFYQLYVVNPNMSFTLNEAVKVLISCWADLTDKTLAKAWNIYSDPTDDIYDRLIRTNQFDIQFSSDLLSINSVNQTNFLSITLNSQVETPEHELSVMKEINTTNKSRPEVNMTEVSDDNESEYDDCDSYLPINELPDSIQDKIRMDCEDELTYINSERRSLSNSRIPIQFVGINNIEQTCYINTTIQVLSSIPGLRGMLPAFCMSNDNAMDLHNDVIRILDMYDESKDQIMRSIPKLESFNIDVKTNIETVCEPFNYGITINVDDYQYHQLFLYIVNDDISDDISLPSCEETLQKFIQGHQFDINKIVGFEKGVSVPYEFPSSFWFDSCFLVAKAFVCNIDNYHYYCYIRDKFTPNFYKISDEVIEKIDWDEIAADETISFVIYLSYEKSDIPEIDNEAINYFAESTMQNDHSFEEEMIDLSQYCPEINELIIQMKENKTKRQNVINPTTKNSNKKKTVLSGWNTHAQAIAPLRKYQFQSRK